jgi:hypothetical protein
MSAELKWLIEVADFMEVLNRGEDRAQKALKEQLPKHEAAFRDDAPGLVQRAFGLSKPPEISGWSSGLVLRGHVGSPFTRPAISFFCPKPFYVNACRRFASWLKFVPGPGQCHSFLSLIKISPFARLTL